MTEFALFGAKCCFLCFCLNHPVISFLGFASGRECAHYTLERPGFTPQLYHLLVM